MGVLPRELHGKHVLDAGCGPGHYAEHLLDRGASVIACDVTPAMVAIARDLFGPRGAIIVEHDLDEPMAWLEDQAVDVVLSALVLDYVADLRSTFREFHRVLKPSGTIVFSVLNPGIEAGFI